LNFVFGEAYIDGRISAIYLPRLRQEFYGLKGDQYVFYDSRGSSIIYLVEKKGVANENASSIGLICLLKCIILKWLITGC
jgi:hypothetical protein